LKQSGSARRPRSAVTNPLGGKRSKNANSFVYTIGTSEEIKYRNNATDMMKEYPYFLNQIKTKPINKADFSKLH
jgi:hypothetical protein